MKKCNKCVRVFKVEGVNTMLAILFVCFTLFLIFYSNKTTYNHEPSRQQQTIQPPIMSVVGMRPNYPYDNIAPRDVYINPYVPPLRDERYNVPIMARVPINVSTNVGAVNTDYRQVGILTPMHGPSVNQILPLMGRPLFTTRSKWQYYTISNQHNNVKLPIMVNRRRGTDEYGVDQLSEGDKVFVQGLKEKFRVTLYDNDTIQYLPYL
jgi:hypothetical protein